jgi:hypothetical protein
MAPLSLQGRCAVIKDVIDYDIKPKTLKLFYKRNNIGKYTTRSVSAASYNKEGLPL